MDNKLNFHLLKHEDGTWDLINPARINRIWIDDDGSRGVIIFSDETSMQLQEDDLWEYLSDYVEWPEGIFDGEEED